jgi:hypothetical protein
VSTTRPGASDTLKPSSASGSGSPTSHCTVAVTSVLSPTTTTKSSTVSSSASARAGANSAIAIIPNAPTRVRNVMGHSPRIRKRMNAAPIDAALRFPASRKR